MDTFGQRVARHALRLGAITAHGGSGSASICFEGRDRHGRVIGVADLEVTPDSVSVLHLRCSPCHLGTDWSRSMARQLGNLERTREELVQ